MELKVLDDFPAEVIRIDEKAGCQTCVLMKEVVYYDDDEIETELACPLNRIIRLPLRGTPPECPLRKFDVVVTLSVGR